MAQLLSDIAVKRAKPRGKDYKLSDSGGLHLLVRKSGTRVWRYKYRFDGKEKLLTIGQYPEVSLQQARSVRDDAKRELGRKIDPSFTINQKKISASDSFKNVSEQWIQRNAPLWSARHTQTVAHRVARLIWPAIGSLPLSAITPPIILQLCRSIERGRPSEIARRVRQYISAVFCYGIAHGLATDDPAAKIGDALLPVPKATHQPAITNLEDLQEMMLAVEKWPGTPVVKLAFRFLALTACRSSEVRGMRWEELADDRTWIIPADRMKMTRPHVVPLSRQAVEIIEAIRPLTEKKELVFASLNSRRPLSDITLSARLKRAGYSGLHVPHGFRASFSSIMNERRPHDRLVIDRMLSHEPRGSVEVAYNRAEYIDARREIAQEWANILLERAVPLNGLIFGPRR